MIPVWVQALVAILAAAGGVGTMVQMVKAVQSYRLGIRQREEEADERLVKRLENRIDALEIERRQDAEYIRRLIMALGRAGIEIPERADERVSEKS